MPKKTKKFEYKPDYVVAPGETFYEIWEEYGWLKEYICKYLDLSGKQLNEFVSGELLITQEFAERLEQLTNVSAKMWMNLDKNYWRRKVK